MPDLPTVMMATVANPLESPWTLGATILLGAGGVGCLVWQWNQVAGTTLFAVWCWAIAALAGLTFAIAMRVGFSASLGTKEAEILHYVSATLALGPGLALLGAKRPQAGMWQGVVVALLAMAWIPAGTALALPAQTQLDVPIYLRVLEAVLVLILAANYIATRSAIPALTTGVGLLALQLVWWWKIPEQLILCQTVGLSACCFAQWHLVANALLHRSTADSVADRLWLDFRDSYGALWALRVAERVNNLAELNGWSLRLEWAGFTGDGGESNDPSGGKVKLNPSEMASAEKALRSLLRRFVSPEWIAERDPGMKQGQ